MTSYYVREHTWRNHSEGEYCEHCNSRTGIGFYVIVTCNARFNQKGFEQYLEFRNMSKLAKPFKSKSKRNRYIKRFTSQEFTESELKKEFKKSCDRELTKEVLNQKVYVTENAL